MQHARRIAPLTGVLLALATSLTFAAQASAAGASHAPDLSRRTLTAKRLQLDTLLARAPRARGLHCTTTVDVPGQGPSCRAGNGSWLVDDGAGTTAMTHGPDVVDASRAFARIAASGGSPVVPAGTKGDIDCVGSGKHIRLVYAYTSDDTLDAAVPGLLRQAFYTMGGFVDDQAKTVRGSSSVHFRATCDASSDAIVDTVHLPHTAAYYTQNGFSSISDDLKLHTTGQGSSTDRASASTRLLVFYASDFNGGYSGQGTLWEDDTADSGNWNNASPGGASVAINYDAYGNNHPDWSTLLHEEGHNNGAVQDDESGYNTSTAPNSSEGGHCIDGHDIMCYADGGAREAENNSEACPTTEVPVEGAFDCGRNDYFNPAPTPGSYLATHWNVASTANGWVDFSAGTASGAGSAPTAPGAPAADTVTETGSYDDTPWDTVPSLRGRWSYLRLTWPAATDVDGGALHYRLEEQVGAAWKVVAVTDATSYAPSSLTCSATHVFRVVAFDDDGNAATGATGSGTTTTQACHGSSAAGTGGGGTTGGGGDTGTGTDGTGTGGGGSGGTGGGTGSTGGGTNGTGGFAGGDGAATTNHAPTAPSAVTALAGSGSVQLGWLAASDPDGRIDHYEVLSESAPGAYVVRTSTSAFGATVGALLPGTAYRFYVVGVDDRGLHGDFAHVDVRTLRDTTPPTRPSARLKKKSATGATITFGAANDAQGIAAYVVQKQVGKGAWKQAVRLGATARGAVVKGLPKAGAVRLRVAAYDRSGNVSYSAVLVVRAR